MAKGNHQENRQESQGQNLQELQNQKKPLEVLVRQRLQLHPSLQRQGKDNQPVQQTCSRYGRERKQKDKASVYASAISLLLFDIEEVLSILSREKDSELSSYTRIATLSLLQAVQALSLIQNRLLLLKSRSKTQNASESNQTSGGLQ